MITRGGLGEYTLQDESFKQWLSERVEALNRHIAARDFPPLFRLEEEMLGFLEKEVRGGEKGKSYNLKNFKNEFIRIYMLSGRCDRAARVAESFLRFYEIDQQCLNREAVVRQIIGRIFLDWKKYDRAEEELKKAIRASRKTLREIE